MFAKVESQAPGESGSEGLEKRDADSSYADVFFQGTRMGQQR
jgi:hypothetical protein